MFLLKGNKTRERAAFQLQSLVEQFTDEKPSAAHRLRMAHSCPLKSQTRRGVGETT